MPLKNTYNTFRNVILPATMNSYSMIFFFNNKLFATVLFFVSFFNFFAGLSGLLAVLLTVLIANSMGLDQFSLKKGIYSFNALLTGIGMGTFFDPSLVFFALLALSALLTLILSVTLGGWLGKYGLPFLSIPFIVSFWFIVLPSAQFENLGLTQRSIFWINDMYAMGGSHLLNLFQTLDTLPINKLVDIYLRSMSSIFFQSNIIAGLIITITLLICSRIFFSLSIVGFLAAYLFAQFSGSEAASITYYNIGANYMMVAFAIGGFFIIPSRYSYMWTVLLIPLTSLVLLFFYKLFGFIQLPVFSLPFAFVVILFLYFLKLRSHPTKLILTPVQYYSPEINLYTYNNNKARLSHFLYHPIYFPFWGEWTVTQGHDGEFTHIGDWGKAFDFMILDDEEKTYKTTGIICEDYHCYNKPVLAPADGFVEEIIDNIDDNEIGKINTLNNWGNTIIIRHMTGVYTQMSHLKKNTFKVSKGNFVKRGDVLANCGNSGRSPEPHLHFQVQAAPLLGSKTIDYPFAYYFEKTEKTQELRQFSKPLEGAKVSGIFENKLFRNAFDILPNTSLRFRYLNENGLEVIEKWDSYTDAYNNKYLYCKETDSVAYYVFDNLMFYFTAFYGNKKSLLYYFYLTAYKVFLGNSENQELKDAMPLSYIRNRRFNIWLHDLVAPFYNYMHVGYSAKIAVSDDPFDTNCVTLHTNINVSFFGKSQQESESSLVLTEKGITEFSYNTGKSKFHATCIN